MQQTNNFLLLQFTSDVAVNKVCQRCSDVLQSLYQLHIKAISTQNELFEAFNEANAKSPATEKNIVEFLTITKDLESDNEALKAETDESSSESTSKRITNQDNLECSFCGKLYRREAHLKRHIEKHHQDGSSSQKRMKHVASCSLCGRRFTGSAQYKEHSKTITCVSVEAPECRFCKEIFLSVSQLKHHLKTSHPRGREHFCHICFMSFPTVSNRNSHLQSHNADDTVKCSICNRGFKSLLYLRKHQKAIHMKIDKTCDICDRKFDTQQRFEYHLKTHEAVKRYKCPHAGCDKSFMQHHHLENHKTIHSGVSRFLCFKCGREFKQECNLRAHLKIHDDDNETLYACKHEDCGKTFKTNPSFRLHVKTHEKASQCLCPECGKKFSQRSSLRVHFQTHFRDPSDRPFKCDHQDCDKSFYQERSIKYHKSTAHGIGKPIVRRKPNLTYFCDFCQQTFKLQSLLKRHLLIHMEDEKLLRKNKCDKCEASFKRPEHLRLHINSVHLKYKPYKCEHPGCAKSFAQIGDRNVHMKVHVDDKPHVCRLCNKAFRLAKGLRAHEKIHEKQNEGSSAGGNSAKIDSTIAKAHLESSSEIVFVLSHTK